MLTRAWSRKHLAHVHVVSVECNCYNSCYASRASAIKASACVVECAHVCDVLCRHKAGQQSVAVVVWRAGRRQVARCVYSTWGGARAPRSQTTRRRPKPPRYSPAAAKRQLCHIITWSAMNEFSLQVQVHSNVWRSSSSIEYKNLKWI